MTMQKPIGILGAGQLGRMIALQGIPLGLRFQFYDTNPDCCAQALGPLTVGPFDNSRLLAEFAQSSAMLTAEFENVPASAIRAVQSHAPFYPSAEIFEAAQDRLSEKTLFRNLGIPTPKFHGVDSLTSLRAACSDLGLPAVLKTRRLGYDGKGQRVLRAPEDIEAAWEALGSVPLIIEQFIPFDFEVSILAARSISGEFAYYPPVQNEHAAGILRVSRAPGPSVTPELRAAGEDYARRVLEQFQYVGVLAIEFFAANGKLLANEMAPRVHNSGHWTIEGAVTGQFENHLRAMLNLPLGSTALRGFAGMVNLIGTAPSLEKLAEITGVHVHLYGKEPRAGRKIGHLTVCEENETARETKLAKIQQLLAG